MNLEEVRDVLKDRLTEVELRRCDDGMTGVFTHGRKWGTQIVSRVGPGVARYILVAMQSLPELVSELDRLTARNAELVEAVKALLEVDWWIGSFGGWFCPWCFHTTGEFKYMDEAKHAPDCPRQRAAALVEEVKE